MNRRGFLQMFGAGVAGIALEQAIPLGRVWSFPSKIVIPDPVLIPPSSGFVLESLQSFRQFATIYYDRKAIEALENNLIIDEFLAAKKLPRKMGGPIELVHWNPMEDVLDS